MTNLKTIALSAAVIAAMTGCGDTTINQAPSNVSISGDYSVTGDTTSGGTTGGTTNTDTSIGTASAEELIINAASLPRKTLSGNLDGSVAGTISGSQNIQAATNITLTADTLWVLDGLVVIDEGVTLTIEPGTVLAGNPGTGDNTSYMIVDKGGKIIADGTADLPIVFTSLTRVENFSANEVGQWGGLTLVGHAGNDQVQPYEVNEAYEADATNLKDNSGILRHVFILNSGITMEQDKEINGLSFVGVGSGTTVEDITIDYSDDDGIEVWGGTVNFTNVQIEHCTDDYFDIDDGFSGTVRNLVVNTTTGNAGIEMSGHTAATFDGFSITTGATQAKEGGIFFKKDGIGGHFKNGTIIHNGGQQVPDGAIHSLGNADIANVSFENVSITAPSNLEFTNDGTNGGSATALKNKFDNGTGNTRDCIIPSNTTMSGNLTGCTLLTADKTWTLDGLVVVTTGAELRIQEGTTVVAKPGTGDNTSYMIVDKGAKIYALGTADKPIVFTSEDTAAEEVGLWGGLTLVGHAGNDQVQPYEVNEAFTADATNMADSSGILRNMKILNSGITMEQDKEVNGLSFVGVGSGTTVEDITIDYSDDDCIETWGGTVNMTNITVSHCTDDHFDIDDGYSGTVKNLVINQTTGNAGIEMSGHTAATFDGFTITQDFSNKEGGIFFKKDGIGGHFLNGTVIDNSVDGAGTIHSLLTADTANISFTDVTLKGSSSDARFTNDATNGGSATEIETIFNNGTGNTKN